MKNYRIELKSELAHQQRVIDEANELGTKIHALKFFIEANPIYIKLDVHECDRLKQQLSCMISYFEILEDRIINF